MSLLDYFGPKPRKSVQEQSLDDLSSEEEEDFESEISTHEKSDCEVSESGGEPKPPKKRRLRSYTNEEMGQSKKSLFQNFASNYRGGCLTHGKK